MGDWSLDVDGVLVEPYFQTYHLASEPDARHGELLSRPAGVARVEEFFHGLTYEQHRRVLTWQLELKEHFSPRTDCRMSINVDNALLVTAEQQEAFVSLIGRYPTPATFEFTETHPMPPVMESNHLLRRIREMGHLSALDDFGTGLNGMSLLTDYDFDVVKVDRSLVYDIATRIEKQKTIRLIYQMLDVLGKKHVVEGIESDEVYQLLRAAGFSVFQGYHFQRPEPLQDSFARLSREAAAP